MELDDLGYHGWCEEKQKEMEGCSLARVTRVDKDRFLVRNEHNEVQAEPTGKLLFAANSNQDLPCVGDWALVQYYNNGDLAIIHALLPRRTFLRRKSAGKTADYQMIAANVDVAFIMQSCDFNFNIRRMERSLVMAHEGHVEPVIVLTKSDLISAAELDQRISDIRNARIDARIIAMSNRSETGLERMMQELQHRKTYCLLGSSGVGKTTLLNHLIGRDAFETAPVREKDSRGRHTTSHRQLTILENGALLIDTPGMRELGLMGVGSSIDENFSDISGLSESCRFTDCTHTVEAGCAVLEAVRSGSVSEERYQSYMKLVKESRFHEMTYVERRKKDKQFGRMIKATLQDVKKRKPSS